MGLITTKMLLESFAEAVKRETERIIQYLYHKHQDLAVATMALQCAYIASFRALKDSAPREKYDELLAELRERDENELYYYGHEQRQLDNKVGIA